MSYAQVEMEVVQWAEAREIIPNQTIAAGGLKMVSEVGELCDAIAKRDEAAIEDGIGDVMVTLIVLCALLDKDLVTCLKSAYQEIKDRTGTLLPNGIFVKDQK